ncbi:MAG: aldose 1-epimerase family protein [Bacteroidetes bacterium]|nr:aldose 1-epimerase family protein [Bacteroidota bacterium]
MQVQLTSASLSVLINRKGAELSSIKNNNGIEYLWQADPSVWARHAPILFPIVGKLKDNCLYYKEQKYELLQHGFARDMDFELISSNEYSCTYQLKPTVETKQKFPFDFIFEISYTLEGNALLTSYHVKNDSKEKMFFSVGAHPAFNCPLLHGEKFEDYALQFESDSFEQTLLRDGLLSDEKKQLHLNNHTLPLTTRLFDEDALVFENKQISKITLRSKTAAHAVIMECKDWPFFGIWSKKGGDRFVCLEPWYGVADGVGSTQKIDEKKGILALEAGEEFTCSFSCVFL